MIKKLIPVFAVLCGAAFAQTPTLDGPPVNGASYALYGLPNGNLAQGSIAIAFGKNLGPSTIAFTPKFPLDDTVGGTSVTITINGTTYKGYPLYSVATQVAFLIPSATPTGTGTVALRFNGQTSNTAPITIVKSSFGAFARNQAGSGPGIFFNAEQSKAPVNDLLTPAVQGQIVTLWGTGLGPVAGNDVNSPQPGNLSPAIPVEVIVGGVTVVPDYAGRSGCCGGVDQINFRLPNTIEGCYVPVLVKIGNVVSNSTTLAVVKPGQTNCTSQSVSSIALDALRTKGSYADGVISLLRSSISGSFGGTSFSSVSDIVSAGFDKFDVNTFFNYSGGGQYTTIGACTVYQSADSSTITDPVQPVGLNAGAVTLTKSGNAARTLTNPALGQYYLQLASGTVVSGLPAPALFLDPGDYTVAGTGGPGANDVGPFTVTIKMPATVNWTNAASLNTVTRANGAKFDWSAPNVGAMVIGGFSSATVPNSTKTVSAGFYCLTDAARLTFTVPAAVLLYLPPSNGSNIGFLSLENSTAPISFSAKNLDVGAAQAGSSVGQTATFQ